MIKEIKAPDTSKASTHPIIFLAGGISACPDWQSAVIHELGKEPLLNKETPRITVYNPRRDDWDLESGKEESIKQIKWEASRLKYVSFLTYYFCNSESPQPITLFELGRYISLLRENYPKDWRTRVVVSVETGYLRELDVVTQCAIDGLKVFTDATPKTHAQAITKAITDIWKF